MSNIDNDNSDDDLDFGNHHNIWVASPVQHSYASTQQSYGGKPQLEEVRKRSTLPQKELGKVSTAQSFEAPESNDDDDDDDDDFFSMFTWSAETRTHPTTQALQESDWPIRVLYDEATEMDDYDSQFRHCHRSKSKQPKSKSHHGSQTISKYKDADNVSRYHKAPSPSTLKTSRTKIIDPVAIDSILTGTSTFISKSRRSKSIDPSNPLEPSEVLPLSTKSRNKSRHPLEVAPTIRSLLPSIISERTSGVGTSKKPLDPAYDPSFLVKTPEEKGNRSVELCDPFVEGSVQRRHATQDDITPESSQRSPSSRSSQRNRSKSPHSITRAHQSTPAFGSHAINVLDTSIGHNSTMTVRFPQPRSTHRVSPKCDLSLSRTSRRKDPSSCRSHRSTPTLHQCKSTAVNEDGSDSYNASFLTLNGCCDEWPSSRDRKGCSHHRERGSSSSFKSLDTLDDRLADALGRQRLAKKKTTGGKNHDRPAMMTVDLRELMAHVMEDVDGINFQ